MFGLGLLWLGLMVRLYDKPGKVKLVLLCILGFLLGGANYMTALSLGIVSFLFIAAWFTGRIEHKGKLLWLPNAFNILGLFLSMIAPGNKVRGAQLSSLNPIVAILRSIYHVFELCIDTWTGFAVLIVLAILAVVAFSAAGSVKIKLSHPVLFSAFAFLMVAANIVPPLYATGSFEAGRMEAIVWMQFVLMMALIVMYVAVWFGQSLKADDGAKAPSEEFLGDKAGKAVLTLVAVLAIGLLLSIHVDSRYLTSASAVTDLISGDAATYLSENKERLTILKDASVLDAELKDHSVHPELLFFSDITEDPKEWINTATAEYYGKNSVKLVK
jgi:hypothetical protein